MKFNIQNIWLKSISKYSGTHLAKAYVVYSIECERAVNTQEWNVISNYLLQLTLNRDRLYVARIWQHNKTIYIIGKQYHGLGYSWDEDILTAIYPVFNSIKA